MGPASRPPVPAEITAFTPLSMTVTTTVIAIASSHFMRLNAAVTLGAGDILSAPKWFSLNFMKFACIHYGTGT